MERIEYGRYGGPEQMKLVPFTPPTPGRGELLVQVMAASINPVDWGIRNGVMKFLSGSSFPRGMGKDLAGVVVKVGSGVSAYQAGDAVLGCATVRGAGAFAPMAIVRAVDVVKKPDGLSFEQAATLPTVGLTAWHGLVDQAKLKQGQSLLINGAAGGVGSAALQIAQSIGAKVVARVGDRSFERMAALGVDGVLDYKTPLPASLNHSFDVVFDSNGSIAPMDADRVLKRGGTVVDITITRAKVLRSLYLRRQTLAFGNVDQKTLLAVTDLAASGKLEMRIGARASLHEAIPLLMRLEAGAAIDSKAVILLN